ncbi:type II toxin-antitoxin system VapC family toxin [Spirosoma litoris]
MSGSKLLLDSNIAIYLSKRVLTISQFAQPGDMLYVSLVTYMEVVGYKFTNVNEESFTNTLFSNLQHLPVTQAVADRVITYRKLRKIKLPDAIILATAREYNCQLVTRNVDDFIGLDNEVMITNPFN